MTAIMQLRILGPLEIHDEARGRRLVVSGQKRPALLATLVVRAGRIVSMDRLIQEIWGDDQPSNAANALQAHIKRLRRLIESACGEPDRIVTQAPGYSLRLRAGETDVEMFNQKVARARSIATSHPDLAIPLLREALGLWRGPAIDGGVIGDICAAEAAVLEENRLSAVETLYDASLRANRHGEIIGELEETSAAHPLRERLYHQLMVALYRCDRQSDAIGVYDRARRRLLEHLGVEPGPALRATFHAVLTHSPRLLVVAGGVTDQNGVDSPNGPDSMYWTVDESATALGEELAGLQRKLDTLAKRQAALLRVVNASSPNAV
jgi:DNA-binding SARP family transcriptional activator